MRLIALGIIVAAAFGAEEAHGADGLTTSKWLHAALLFALLAYAWRKFATPALRARGDSIRRELETSKKLKQEADERVRGIESRLGNLSGEISAFQAESETMIAKEGERVLRETAQLLARVESRTRTEIETLTKGAIASVKAEAAREALELAKKKVAGGLSPSMHDQLVSGFLQDLEQARN